MQNRNPYAAPQTNVARGDGVEEYGEVKLFSVSGRIGRVRYIAYSIGLSILLLLALAIATGLLALADPTAAIAVAGIGYVVAAYAAQILPGIQRSHDMNVTGWLSLIVLVPLGPLVFWIAPGTRGENGYGKRPPPNSAGVIIVACIVPFLFFGGILAAIAIPAYQDYTIRAQVSEGLSLAVGPKEAVADAYARSNEAPVDRSAAGLSPEATDTSGQYVESVDIAGGTILVTYGVEANSIIAGRVLGLQPYVTSDRAVVWRCGAGPAPQGAVPMDAGAPLAAGATDIDTIHLPSLCRSVITP